MEKPLRGLGVQKNASTVCDVKYKKLREEKSKMVKEFFMKRRWPIVGTVCGILVVGIVGVAMSQPPEGRDGPPRRPENGGDHHHPPHDQLREALDADHDHQLSVEEIKMQPLRFCRSIQIMTAC